MTRSRIGILSWLVGLSAVVGLGVGLLATRVEGQVPCRRDCPASFRDPRGCCSPDAPSTEPTKRSRRCRAGEHASGGRCCADGAEWVPAKRSCVCLTPGGCGGARPPAAPIERVSPYAAPARTGSWVTVRAGSFVMGTPFGEPMRDTDEAQHTVTLTTSFLMGATEVTQSDFQSAMGYNPSENPCGATCPLENVNWHEAAAYANALSVREGRSPCYVCTGSGQSTFCNPIGSPYSCPGYRLPTEAEWEYAARAGTHWATYRGDVMAHLLTCERPNPILDGIAWYCGNSGRTTHPVASLQPNAWGLYDMLGNVYEWVHDWYGQYQVGSVVDPWGPVTGDQRVVRGGSFCCTHNRDVRAGERMSEPPAATRHSALGIRLVRRQ